MRFKNGKPRVGIDVDGVLADLLGEIFPLAKEMYGIELHVDHMKDWEIDNLLPEGKSKEFWDAVGRPGLHKRLKPYPGAVEGMAALDKVADIYIVTSYLHNGETWVYERDEWIMDTFGISKKKMIHTSAKYTFNGLVLVDDKPQNIIDFIQEPTLSSGVLWTQPYNKNFEFPAEIDPARVIRSNDWEFLANSIARSWPV